MNNQTIDFKNGSSITALPVSKSSEPYTIIGVDMSNGEDYSCVACRCRNCGTVLGVEHFNHDKDIDVPVIKKCNHCGAKFRRSYIFE